MCEEKPILLHIRVIKLQQSFRKTSTIAGSCSMNPLARWPISNWAAPTRSKVTPPRVAPRIKISSHSGKTPTQTFPSLSNPRRSMQSCSSFVDCLAAEPITDSGHEFLLHCGSLCEEPPPTFRDGIFPPPAFPKCD